MSCICDMEFKPLKKAGSLSDAEHTSGILHNLEAKIRSYF